MGDIIITIFMILSVYSTAIVGILFYFKGRKKTLERQKKLARLNLIIQLFTLPLHIIMIIL